MNALGPVIGNRFADERKTQLKPHLMRRLVAEVVRAVPMGTVVHGEDGRMAFVPNYTHTTTKTAPKAAPAEGDDERAVMAGFDPMTEPLQVGDVVEIMVASHSMVGQHVKVVKLSGNGVPYTSEDDGRLAWKDRACVKLIRKADPTRKPS